MMDTYKFQMWSLDSGVAVIDESTGEMFELWKITNDLTYDNPTTGQDCSRSRDCQRTGWPPSDR